MIRKTRLYGLTALAWLTLVLAVVACPSSPLSSDDDGGAGGTPGGQTPALAAVVLTPPSAAVPAGSSQQFQAQGQLTDGSTAPVQVTYSATGGTITAAGLYTAGTTPGAFRVVAAGPGGRADTSSVTITAPTGGGGGGGGGQPPGNFTAVIGDDWRSYTSKAALAAKGYFWWHTGGDVYTMVDLVPDPLFGQVVRITFPQNTGSQGPGPRLSEGLPTPLDKMWYRWKMRYSPGWTTVGPDPAGHANAYKLAFWTWDGYDSRGGIEYTSTDQYVVTLSAKDRSTGQFLRYTEKFLPGSAPDFGRVTTEWTDNQWWEFVVYYEKTGATTARQHWWRRRLTTNGQIAPAPWFYLGVEISGATTPRVNAIDLGANKNKNNPQTQYIYWGPWEVVDGSRYPDPFGMSNPGTSPPPPASGATLSQVVLNPATASLQPGQTAQFQASGRMSDGTTSAVSVTYSAAGGTISSSGLYTAGSTTGSFRVIATEPSSGLADTSAVTISAPSATLRQVVINPASASIQTGGTVQFSAQGQMSDGTTRSVTVSYTATGGTINSSGLYTAGSSAGSFRVIATATGSTLADTAAVTIAAPPPPPPPPPPAGSYGTIAGDDWGGYTATSQLTTKRYYSSADVAYLAFVNDATFGQVLRITQPAGTRISPQLHSDLGGPQDRVWYRWRMKLSRGWTADGSNRGSSTFGIAAWAWSTYTGQGSVEVTNGRVLPRLSVRDPATGAYVKHQEALLPGSRTDFGPTTTELTDGEWWEYVVYYEKTGPTTANQRYWRRRLTSGGQIVSSPWIYHGLSLSGGATPQVQSVRLGLEKSKNSPATQYVYWGKWEVVNGTQYANPFGMPNL